MTIKRVILLLFNLQHKIETKLIPNKCYCEFVHVFFIFSWHLAHTHIYRFLLYLNVAGPVHKLYTRNQYFPHTHIKHQFYLQHTNFNVKWGRVKHSICNMKFIHILKVRINCMLSTLQCFFHNIFFQFKSQPICMIILHELQASILSRPFIQMH